MQNWGLFIVVIVVLAASLPAVMQQWRTDRSGVSKTLWLAAIYLVYVGLGIALLFLLVPAQGTGEGGEDKALELTLVVVGWIFYGALTRMGVVPAIASRRDG